MVDVIGDGINDLDITPAGSFVFVNGGRIPGQWGGVKAGH